jgi:hypothetical protein
VASSTVAASAPGVGYRNRMSQLNKLCCEVAAHGARTDESYFQDSIF